MKRFLGGLAAMGLLVCAAAFAGRQVGVPHLQLAVEDRNPWNNLRLNNDADDFQFAIVSDRTGGHRPTVFSRAIEQLNLLQPEFVVSVGDLIEGYTENPARLADEWREFQGYVARLQMPFFYVPGNHDISNPHMERIWKERFGRRYYHFVYRNVLFLLLCSEDPPGKDNGRIADEQAAYVKRTLAENAGVRWTLVFLHKPLWIEAKVEETGWLKVEELLNGRPYTVVAGHVHRYERSIRNGQRYYQLATTGGSSKMRGTRYGEFDHIVWVTMKEGGPVLANILLDGVLPEDLRRVETGELGVLRRDLRATHAVRGVVYYDGTPLPHAQVVFHPADSKAPRADALSDVDGTFTLSTYTPGDGAPAGEYDVTVVASRPRDDQRPVRHLLPARLAKKETSGLRLEVKPGPNEFRLDLKP